MIADAFSVLETESAAVGAQVSLPDTSTQVTVDQAEIQEVIVNMLQNSLYWLRQVPQDHRKVAVCVRRKSADEVEIVFSDSGPGVEAAVRDYYFRSLLFHQTGWCRVRPDHRRRDYQRILCR